MSNDAIQMLAQTSELQTKRLKLRPFKDDDDRDVWEYASDPQTLEMIIWVGVLTLEDAKQTIQGYYRSKPGIYAIEHLEDRKCIGCIDLTLDLANEKADFGYILNRHYWNQGYMTEVLTAILTLCFHKLELNRVEATHYAPNIASGRVMEKCGMRCEGMAKDEQKVKGKFRDVVHYGITRAEWMEMNNRTNHKPLV